MTVTFCGHGKTYYNLEIKEKLREVIERLVKAGADNFLLGGYGNFDIMAAHTVREIKKEYPNIKSILVIPYIERKYDENLYDSSLYPPIENIQRRFAIIKRNEYMVSSSDVIVAYIDHDFGGASKTFNYAKRKKKKVINLFSGDITS